LRLAAAAALGVFSISGSPEAQPSPNDAMAYFGGPVLSPQILCLMWSPGAGSGGFTSTDTTNFQDYVSGLDQYFTNMAIPPGATSGAGTEPVPRQHPIPLLGLPTLQDLGVAIM